MKVEFVHEVRTVRLGRAATYSQPACDLGASAAFGGQVQDFFFPSCKRFVSIQGGGLGFLLIDLDGPNG